MLNKNIWMFNHYAQGPNLPGGTRHYDFAIELIKREYNVTIFAAAFHHVLLKNIVNYNEEGYFEEEINGVKFIWVKTYPYKINDWRRMLNIASYAFKLNNIIPKLNLKKPNFIIGSTVHPFAPLIALKLAKKYDAKYIMEIRDLWPQTFIDMGLWGKHSFKSKFFKYIERISVTKSDKIIFLSPLTLGYLKKEYNYKDKNTILLTNGVSKNYVNKNLKSINSTKINITYLGGIEKVHGLEFIVDLAKEVHRDNIEFNIYGDGKEKEYLKNKGIKNNINNLFWNNPVPKNEVPNILSKANLLFVSTSNVLYGSENKLYDYMASGRPIVIATKGNHNDPVKEIGCGISLDRDQIKASANKLVDFIDNNANDFEIIGRKGQDYVINNRTINLLVSKLVDFIEKK